VASGPANALAGFQQARTQLVDLLIEHRLTPHLDRLQTRLQELTRFDRDPSTESLAIRVGALRAVVGLLTEAADQDPPHAAGLALHVATRLQLDPLTVFDEMYPPDEEADTEPGDEPQQAAQAGDPPGPGAVPQPHPDAISPAGAASGDLQAGGHRYAHACPPDAPAATWVQHDPNTGHSAWVLAEGIGHTPADRLAARLAAEVAGRVAVLVGAHKAVEIARTALDAHFGVRDRSMQGSATIAVLTSFDGDHAKPGRGRFTVAWAGDTCAYAVTGRWLAPLTVDHTLREQGSAPDQRHRAAVALLAEPAQPATSSPNPHEQRLIAQATDHTWLATADLLDLAILWRTARTHEHQIATARAVAETVEDRLRQMYPQAMQHYDQAVHTGAARADAMRAATGHLPGTPRRPGDGGLTSSVRGGPIGVNRIDLPATQILLAGRDLREADVGLLRDAVEGHRPGVAVSNVRKLGGASSVAMVVRPQPDHVRDAMTAARLARQDRAAPPTGSRGAEAFARPGRTHRAALPAVPASHTSAVR
jgi:hypothetical protein